MLIRAVALGQALSLLIALTGIFSSALVQQGVLLPASQSVLHYLCLALTYGSILVARKQKLRAKLYKYAAVAALDVIANFCLVQAYLYTTLTSVTLLDCFTVPCVLLLSWLWLDARYRLGHWAGAFVCLGGLAVLVTTDSAFSSDIDAPRPLLGDGLVLLGAALYAVSNVIQEKMLAEVGRVELLGLMGTFSSVWGGALAVVLEHRQLLTTPWSVQAVVLFLGFNVALFAFSSLVPFVLSWGGAATLNLSLLTADLWAALARLLFFGGFTAGSAVAFSVSFLLVGSGLVTFTQSGHIYERSMLLKHEELEGASGALGAESLASEECLRCAEGTGLLEGLPDEPLASSDSRIGQREALADVELEDRKLS